MNYGLVFRTVKHLRPTQIYYQVKNRLVKARYVPLPAPAVKGSGFKTDPIPRYKSLEGNKFTFLNLEHEYAGWTFTDNGMLWAYNQNYFDWLNQEGMTAEEGCKWIDKFIEDIPTNKVGLDPYPIALRSINWIKFFCRYPETATKERLDALYSQVRLLEKKLEYHLLANHLLEDSFALYIAGAYFDDERLLKKAKKLLLSQLKEQVLPDGAHYEQSPMYHCILLDRLLDCINIGERMAVNGVELRKYAVRMLGHLESIVWSDGSIPLLNDAAYDIAPTPEQLFDYARRLDIKWKPIAMKECGYRKMKNELMEAIVDVGNITATYQPGHTHADTFNYELRIDGKPLVVDTGISTYNKNERRQYERSSKAHNCVIVDGMDSSEVWGGFRVGKRANVFLEHESPLMNHKFSLMISAEHDGYNKPVKRRFEMSDGVFVVEDWYDGEAVSYVHLAEGVDESRITVEGVTEIEIKPCKYSTEYNLFHDGKVLAMHFNGKLKYTIR